VKKVTEIIGEAFGEVSALFMSQDVKGTEIVMPTEEMDDILERTVEALRNHDKQR